MRPSLRNGITMIAFRTFDHFQRLVTAKSRPQRQKTRTIKPNSDWSDKPYFRLTHVQQTLTLGSCVTDAFECKADLQPNHKWCAKRSPSKPELMHFGYARNQCHICLDYDESPDYPQKSHLASVSAQQNRSLLLSRK